MILKKAFIFYCIGLLVLIGCYNSDTSRNTNPKKVEIYWGDELSSTEYLDTNGHIVEKINPTFIAFQLEDCPSADSSLKWEYKYKQGKLIWTKEIQSCQGEVRNVEIEHTIYDNENRIIKTIKTDTVNDTLSITNYQYKGNVRYSHYLNLENDYTAYDSITINQDNHVKEDRKIAGDMAMIDLYEYDSLGRKSFWRQVYIKNDTDTVRNRLGKYYYNELNYPEKINVVEVDKDGNEIEKKWISYRYTYFN